VRDFNAGAVTSYSDFIDKQRAKDFALEQAAKEAKAIEIEKATRATE
jgi:hypothetical protein